MLNEKAATASFDTATAPQKYMSTTSQMNTFKRPKMQSFIDKEAIRQALSFEQLAQHYGLELFANGQMKCPLHGEDRRPSASIKGGFFHCFACNESLDMFAFIMAMERCTFSEALRIATDITGIAFPEQNSVNRRQVALVVQERKHDTAERQRIAMSGGQKYLLLATVARTVRPKAPQYLAKLDALLDDWLHGVPNDVDLRPLLTLVQGKHFEAIGPVVDRLHDEQEWTKHA